MVMMHLLLLLLLLRRHPRYALLPRPSPRAQAGRQRNPSEALLHGHLGLFCILVDELARVDLGHAPHATRAQSRVLVAVAPAVDGALDEAALGAQTGVELCQGPADRVALALVDEPVAAVLILAAAGARVHAVLRLEFGAERVDVDGFHVAPDRVFHLDAVPRVLEGDPLHAVSVLAHNERCRCRDRPWGRAGIDAGPWDVAVRAIRRCGIHDLLVMLGQWLALGRGC